MIRIENMTFGYGKGKKVFSDFSLELSAGHIHGLLGSNGIGKTTLLKMISGFILPDGGAVRIDGMDPSLRKPSLLRNMMLIPEEFGLPGITFRQYVKVTSPFYSDFSHEQLDYYAQNLEVEYDRKLDKLSMGQKKKAFTAFALACNTKMLLMDEPTNGLDIPSKGIFRRLIAGYASPERLVVISTHQVRDIENLIDNIVIINDRGILINDTVEQITRKLSFGPVEQGSTPIYAEDMLSGMWGVTENARGVENKINLELLFNAAIAHRDRISEIMNKKTER